MRPQQRRFSSALVLVLLLSATVSAAKDSPAARQVIDRYVEATGGEEAILASVAMHYSGTLEVSGIDGTFELHRADGKALFAIDIPGVANIRQGYNGVTAWTTGQGEPALLEGAQLEQMQQQADPASELRRSVDYSSIESLGLEEFEGKTLHAIELTTRSGQSTTEYYDPESGFRAAEVSVQSTAIGDQEIVVLFDDYKRFGDLMIPTRIEQRGGGQTFVRTIEAVDFDPINEAVFVLPDPIQELIEEAK